MEATALAPARRHLTREWPTLSSYQSSQSFFAIGRQPLDDVIRRASLLIGSHDEGIAQVGSGRPASQYVLATAQSITAVGDEQNQRLAGEVVRGEERLDDRRRRLAPDREAEVDRVVAGDARNLRRERRLETAVAIILGLRDRLEVVVGIGGRRLAGPD